MARYDPDRIAALAAGQLHPDEASALEREIAGDPRASVELAAQRRALAALRQEPPPILSAEERSTLRRAVAAALHLEESAVARVVPTRRRLPWRPIAVAAAALAVIAGIVPLVGLLSVGGDQAAMTTTAEAAIAARNWAEETSPDAALTTGAAESFAGDGDLLTGELSTGDPSAEAARALESLLADPVALITAAEEDLATCAAEAEALLGAGETLSAAPVQLESGEAVAWFSSPGGASLESLALFSTADCTLLAGPLPDPTP